MLSDRAKVLNYFYRLPYSSSLIDFQELLISSFIKVLDRDSMSAEASISKLENTYWNELLRLQDEDSKRGIKPIFTIVDKQGKKVSFQHLSSNNGDRKQKIHNKMLRARPLILQQIDLLTDREYEALACLACECIGANNTMLTPAGNEGGIDFIATIKFPEKSHFLFGEKGPIRIIGQCKKYSTRVQVDKVKEFITTLQEVKNQTPSVERVIPNWFRSSSGPIIGWIISHNGFQAGSITKSMNHGFVLSDSIDIAQLLSLSNRYHVFEDPQERAIKLKEHINEILVESEEYEFLSG